MNIRLGFYSISALLFSATAFAAPNNFQNAVLGDSPYIYYRLGEASGTTASDVSGNGFNGTYASTLNGPLPTLGASGFNGGDTAVTFGPTTNCVGSPATALGSKMANVSFEFVFKTTSTSTKRSLVASVNTGTATALFVDVNEKADGTALANWIRFYLRDESGNALGVAFTNSAAFDGNYHHLVCAYNSGGTSTATRYQMYLDGVAQTLSTGSSAGTGVPTSFAAFGFNPTIGAANNRGTTNQPFPGTIDEVAFYTNTLSASQVFNHYFSVFGLTNLTWAVGNGTWDTSTPNWSNGSGTVVYQEINGFGNRVTFDDTAAGSSPITVTLNSTVVPGAVTNNSSKNYTISGSGSISGLTGLTKAGSGTLTLGTANAFSNVVTLNAGTLALAASTGPALGSASSLVINGGTVQWTSGITEDISTVGGSARPVTISGAVVLDTGANAVTLGNPIGNNGAGSVTKIGTGTLTLNGVNKYAGNTVVANGTLTLSGGTYISNSPAIIVNSGAILDATAVNLTLSTPVNQILAGVGTVNGMVTVPTGTTITPATNGVYGTLTLANDLVVSGGSLVLDVSTNNRDLIAVGGNVTINSGSLVVLNIATPLTNGVYRLISYAGSLIGGSASVGNLTLVYSQPGKAVTLDGSVAGEIDLVVVDNAGDSLLWSGAGNTWDTTNSPNWLNGATPWAYTNGDIVRFDNAGVSQPTVYVTASVAPGSITVSNDAATYDFVDGTGTGGGKVSGSASLTKDGTGTLIVETENVNSGSTSVKSGTLQVGNGGAGSIGTGNITNNGTLIFYQNANHTVNAITGSGSLVQSGSATLTLAQNNNYSGTTTINGGTLQVGTGGATGTIGTNAILVYGTLSLNSAAITVVPTNISGSGALRLQAASVKTLSALNQYQGSTYVDNGTLKLTAPDLIPDANSVSGSSGSFVLDGGAASAGTFDLNGFNETINALAGATGTVKGAITNSGASAATTNVLTILENSGTTCFATISENPSGSKVQLVLHGNSELRLNSANSYSGGTYVGDTATIGLGSALALGSGSLTLSNGTTFTLRTSSTVNTPISIVDGAAASFNSSALGNPYSGLVTGSATATNIIIGPFSASASTAFQYGAFFGTVQIPTGGTLRFSSSTLDYNGGTNTTFDLEGGTLQTRNAGTVYVGALTGASGTIANPQAASGTGVFIIGTKGTDSTFSGTITGTNAIVKSGPAKLTLNGSLSYYGSTTVSNGTLVIGDINNNAVTLDNSPTINLRSSTALLDVSGRSDGSLNLGNVTVQTLSGFGTVAGSVNEAANSTVSVGLGTLTITNVATLNGALLMQVNRTNAINASKLIAGSLVNASALTVSNVGPALQGGETFQLFNGAITGFTATNLPTLTGNLYWTNKLAIDGSIAVINPINPNPPVLQASVSGNTLSLAWPTNAGWILQSNSVSLVNTSAWFNFPANGAVDVTNINVTLDPAKTNVFFRMLKP